MIRFTNHIAFHAYLIGIEVVLVAAAFAAGMLALIMLPASPASTLLSWLAAASVWIWIPRRWPQLWAVQLVVMPPREGDR